MRYTNHPSRKFDTGLPSCLHAVIKRRRFMEPSQDEIAEVARGNETNLNVLNKFLQWHGLICEHAPAKKISLPIFLETALNDAQDVIAVYDFFRIFPMKEFEFQLEYLKSAFRNGDIHFSLVERYLADKKKVEMTDSYSRERLIVGEESLGSAMNSPAHGFYVVRNID